MIDLYLLNPFCESSKPEPILREAFAWEDNGIFVALQSAAEASSIELPWESEDAETLDLAYFGNHSGGKFCSPIVKLLLQTESTVDEEGRINSTGTRKLANILLRKYFTNWTSLWATNVASYDPIHNYNMYEERDLITTEDEEIVTDGTLERTGRDTLDHEKDEYVDHGKTSEEMAYRYGINTDTENPKPSDRVYTTDGGTTRTTDTVFDLQNKNFNETNDVTETTDNDGTEHEEIHRYGNIGVTTTQKLLQEERQLWLWNYFDQIFTDLDRELALSFHDPCRV